MDTYTTPLALASKLISLPSYVNTTQNEIPVADFLSELLAAELPGMILEKQYIDANNTGRYNVLLRGNKDPEILVIGHIDTVQPKAGWDTDPFRPTVSNGRLYGLGAADMKSSLAAFISALIKLKSTIDTNKLMVLMYADEEYEFKGIKRFLNTKRAIRPKMILSLDGALEVTAGCRGLIELRLTFSGKSGHAANPANGVNAIVGSVTTLQDVNEFLERFEDDVLGKTTTNIAAIRGGVMQTSNAGNVWLQNANVIADAAEIVFEVRPSTATVDAGFVISQINQAAKRRGLKLTSSQIYQDISPWPVTYSPKLEKVLKSAYESAGEKFTKGDQKLRGYIDAEMVANQLNVPTYIIGTGGENKHGANENVPVVNIKKATAIYESLLTEFLL